MTDFYKNNDEQIRNKLTQHEFEQVSSAWDSMSKLLDQQQTVPKRAIAWWWSIPLVAAATLTGVILIGMNNTKEERTQNSLIAHNNTTKVTTNTNNKDVLITTNVIEEPLVTTTKNNASNNSVVNPDLNATVITNTSSKKNRQGTSKKATLVKKDNNTTVDNSTIVAPIEAKNSSNAIDNETSTTTEETIDNAESVESNNKKVKTTRTIVRYQYSTTPLRALQEKRKGLTEPISTIGSFGIGQDKDIKKSPIKIGVFAGSSIKAFGLFDEVSLAPYVGVTATCRVAPRHAIQTGLQYKSMGQFSNSSASEVLSLINTQANFISASNSYTLTRIDMLELPLLYQFYATTKWHIQAGVKAAYLFNVETNNSNFNDKTNDELGLSNFDFGMLLGIEYCFNKHWSMALQYSLGFVNLTERAQQKQDETFAAEAAAGYDVSNKMAALTSDGELIVPVSNVNHRQEMLRLPNQLYNTDLLLLLKYTF